MEGIVAKRCLRENRVYNNYEGTSRSLNRSSLDNIYKKNHEISKKLNKQDTNSKNIMERIVFKLKMSIWIQSITAMCLLITIVCLSMLDVKLIDNNKYVKIIKEEYKKDYPLKEVKSELKNVKKYCYTGIAKIIPDKIENKFKSIYVDFKKKLTENNHKDVTIYSEENKEKNENTNSKEVNKNILDKGKEGVGVSIEENVESVDILEKKEVVSAISSQDRSIKYIVDNNIKFVMPTKGTVSSRFGAREVIFKDIDPYHTGIDIANSKGTEIVAATDGIVTKVAYNKYNGNFVEITNGKVVTKYAHMEGINVKHGKTVKAKEKIGTMGETGYATGPHLHFEVVIEGIKIDPEKVLDI